MATQSRVAIVTGANKGIGLAIGTYNISAHVGTQHADHRLQSATSLSNTQSPLSSQDLSQST